jgi:hypothetical protein
VSLNAKTDIGEDGNPTLTSGGAGKRHATVLGALVCKKSLLMLFNIFLDIQNSINTPKIAFVGITASGKQRVATTVAC